MFGEYLKTNVGYEEEMTMMVNEEHILSDLSIPDQHT